MSEDDKQHAHSLFLAAQHQLRQPLNAISLLIGELRQGAEGRDLEAIIGDMTHALDLSKSWLDSLVDLENAERGLLKLHFQALPLQPVFTRLRDDFAPRFAVQGLGFRVAPTTAVAWADPVLLRQLLSLLLDNAAKFTRHGKVLLGCRRAGDDLRIEVWDSGLGVAEGDRARMFDPFFRLDNEVRPRERGLGLGLSIARLLAGLAGNELNATSRLGQGSCFALTLRRSRAGSSGGLQSAEPAASYSNPMEGVDVLLLEEAEAPALRQYLQAWGALPRQILPAELAAALVQRPRLVIADRQAFDAGDGWKFMENGGQVPTVILLTDQPPSASDPPRAGINFLQRPVKAARLRALCHYALAQH